MKLDSRIIEGKKPLDCFDTKIAEQFLGKKGYFSNYLDKYTHICNTQEDVLQSLDEHHDEAYKSSRNKWEFFLPAEWVKKESYRPYRLREFLHKFKFGDAIYIRPKNSKTNEERMVIFSEYRTELYKDESNDAESVRLTGIEHRLKSVVCLGIREYDLTTLFDSYEYFDVDGKEWKIFGIKSSEEEE